MHELMIICQRGEELDGRKKELDDDKASHRSVNSIEFTGELFKSKILSEAVMHGRVQRLLKTLMNRLWSSCLSCSALEAKELEETTVKRVEDFDRMDSKGREDVIQGVHHAEGHSGC